MSRQDFERCTPQEFSQIVEQNNALEELRFREGWERTRIEVVSVANLFSKRPLNAKAAFPLPWDKGTKPTSLNDTPKGTSSPDRAKEVMGRLRK